MIINYVKTVTTTENAQVSPPGWVVQTIESLLQAKMRIAAIRLLRCYVREHCGWPEMGLREAKEAVEAHETFMQSQIGRFAHAPMAMVSERGSY